MGFMEVGGGAWRDVLHFCYTNACGYEHAYFPQLQRDGIVSVALRRAL